MQTIVTIKVFAIAQKIRCKNRKTNETGRGKKNLDELPLPLGNAIYKTFVELLAKNQADVRLRISQALFCNFHHNIQTESLFDGNTSTN